MTRTVPAWIVVAALSAGAVALAGQRAAASRAAALREHAELERLATQARELRSLRAAAASPESAKATPGLASRVGTALSRAGLPASCLSSLSPEAQSVQRLEGSRVGARRQRATLVLTSLTLPQLGSLLQTWRTDEPAWMITGVEVAAAQGPPPPTGGDLPLRAVLVLESLVIDAPSPAPYPFVKTSGGPR
jgi:hypothetical protein